MYKFSIRHWSQRRQEQRELAAEPKIISKELFSPLRNIVCMIQDYFFFNVHARGMQRIDLGLYRSFRPWGALLSS
jgi:hypothetical protein